MNDAKRAAPRGMLLDYGGTLVEEASFDPRAGMQILLTHVAHRPPNVSLGAIIERVDCVTEEVGARRDEFQIETPWPALTRLIYDYFGVRFAMSLDELELAFWNASVTTRPMAGAREVLGELHRAGIALGVVSNSSFRGEVIRHELSKHGLAEHLSIVVASADYAVRKPNPLLFETAAGLLGVCARDIWFVGDRPDTDVAGARAAGMHPVWFGGHDAGTSDGDVLVVSDWRELLQVVQAAFDRP
ncbi:MAG TPA: HAD family hydrolase [Gemmatimonadaceae bacterium]|jgi:putative hydrolase of the HAD superfamily|nr:HAD family hydrolase [Gemmatimonadaceae bacterium]